MASSSALPLPPPRLRLSRNSPSSVHDYSASQNIAYPGSSRLQNPPRPALATTLLERDDDDELLPTPKASTPLILPGASSNSDETPATRLRAVLSRVPIESRTPVARPPPSVSLSELESDFEPLNPVSGPSSMAQESLKDLFEHALRDPGDTPSKGRRRRNSIDTSEVESSPRVARERAKNKGKRKSLSDEEAENPSSGSIWGISSFSCC